MITKQKAFEQSNFIYINSKETDKSQSVTNIIHNKYVLLYKYKLNKFSNVDGLAKFLYYYKISDKKLKMLSNLKPKQRYGYLIRLVGKVAVENGIPKTYIDRYYHVKNAYAYERTPQNLNILRYETACLILATVDKIEHKSERVKKIEEIFFSENK